MHAKRFATAIRIVEKCVTKITAKSIKVVFPKAQTMN